MAELWVPPTVNREHLDQRRQYEAELLAMTILHEQLDDFNKELRQIDPHLQLVWAPENVHAAGLVPGRYHLIRHNPGAPPSVIPLTGPNGEFCEPTSAVYDLLRKSDLWSDRAVRDQKKRERDLEEAERKRKEREREELRDEAYWRFKAKENPGVAFTDRPWTWRANAPKDKKAA